MEFVQTHVILAPGASEVLLGAAVLSLRRLGARGAELCEVTLCAGALLESHLLGIGRQVWTQSHPKLPLGAQVAPNGPTEPQGSQREAKEMPGRAPWEPEAPQRVPTGSPKSPQGEQNELQSHPTETNKSENYTHINKIHANSRSTAI